MGEGEEETVNSGSVESKGKYWAIGLKKVIVIVIAVLAISVFYVAGNTVKVPYTAMVTEIVKEPTVEKQCGDVQKPYSEEVCKDVTLGYNTLFTLCKNRECSKFEDVCDSYSFVGICLSTHKACTSWSPAEVKFKVNNLDNKYSGLFKGLFGVKLIDNNTAEKEFEGVIQPGSSMEWSYSIDAEMQGCSGFVTDAPTKPECHYEIKYRTEQECKDVTVIKDVEKQKEEIKYRTLFQEWGLVPTK